MSDARTIKQYGDPISSNTLGVVVLGEDPSGNAKPLATTSTGSSNTNIIEEGGVAIVTTPESGTDDTGADTYATILTPSKSFTHIAIINEGTNPAVVSIDGGSTDTFVRIAGSSYQAFDQVAITATAIQAKNFTAGSNYTNLTVVVW